MSVVSKIKTIFCLIKQKFCAVKGRRIVFSSFNGYYSDSPRSVSEKIHELDKSIEIIWLVNQKNLAQLPKYVKGVSIENRLQCAKVRGSAAVLFDNVYAGQESTLTSKSMFSRVAFKILTWLKKKKRQKTYTTWHGTPLKRMGRDQLGNNVYDFNCYNTTMILGNKFTLDIMNRLTFGKINMVLLGTPRNDMLFGDKRDLYKDKLAVPSDKKVLLYAPTFRNDGKDCFGKNVQRSGLNQLYEMDIEQLLNAFKTRFGGDWVLVCRFHYHVEKMVNWKELEIKYGGKIINGNKFDEMSEYLACSDALLTDASSSMFDYIHTQRPCFLYFPDLDNYQNKERGFYVSIDELPYTCAENCSELIDNVLNFDEKRYLQGISQVLENFEYVDDIQSSERVARFVLEEAFKN